MNLRGIWQAAYTAGVVLPKPVATAQYWHRSLNPKKLIGVGFSRLAVRPRAWVALCWAGCMRRAGQPLGQSSLVPLRAQLPGSVCGCGPHHARNALPSAGPRAHAASFWGCHAQAALM